ncbi:hypothetical protein [Phocaeicola sp.]
MEQEKIEAELGLIFSISRECPKDTSYFLAHLEGGVVYLESLTEELPGTDGKMKKLIFIFKAAKIGSAAVQLASVNNATDIISGKFDYEDITPIEVIPV